MCLALAFALVVPPLPDKKDKHSIRFGDLQITAIALMNSQDEPHPGDHHRVRVGVSLKNLGKRPVCASFSACLTAAHDLKYRSVGSEGAPQVDQLPPGAEISGEYVFSMKDGVEPLSLILKPEGRSLGCDPGHRDPLRDALLPEEIHLEVHDLQAQPPAK
jgi:hypothetical protein